MVHCLHRKAFPTFKKNIAMQCLQKPTDNFATFDFLQCHHQFLIEGATSVKQEPHSPPGGRQKYWLFQTRGTTSPVTGRHCSCEKSLNNSGLWRSGRPNSCLKQGCAEHHSPGEPPDMDRLHPGSRQDQREST